MFVKELYKQPKEVSNKAKLIIACNEEMKIFAHSEGMQRRLLVIRMPKAFTSANGKIPEYHNVLLKEASGIFKRLFGKQVVIRNRDLEIYLPKYNSTIKFSHLQYDSDVNSHLGAQYSVN
jgi:hypothetical protein